jgi:hypothetical protein
VNGQDQSLVAQARTLAVLNVALADALIACFDAKYAYNAWRPVTAIQAGVGDVGPAPDWLPLIATPPFPAYPSAQACAAGAAAEVLWRHPRARGPGGRPQARPAGRRLRPDQTRPSRVIP